MSSFLRLLPCFCSSLLAKAADQDGSGVSNPLLVDPLQRVSDKTPYYSTTEQENRPLHSGYTVDAQGNAVYTDADGNPINSNKLSVNQMTASPDLTRDTLRLPYGPLSGTESEGIFVEPARADALRLRNFAARQARERLDEVVKASGGERVALALAAAIHRAQLLGKSSDGKNPEILIVGFDSTRQIVLLVNGVMYAFPTTGIHSALGLGGESNSTDNSTSLLERLPSEIMEDDVAVDDAEALDLEDDIFGDENDEEIISDSEDDHDDDSRSMLISRRQMVRRQNNKRIKQHRSQLLHQRKEARGRRHHRDRHEHTQEHLQGTTRSTRSGSATANKTLLTKEEQFAALIQPLNEDLSLIFPEEGSFIRFATTSNLVAAVQQTAQRAGFQMLALVGVLGVLLAILLPRDELRKHAGQLELKLQKSIKEMEHGGQVYSFMDTESPQNNPLVYTYHQIILETLVEHASEVKATLDHKDKIERIQKSKAK